MFYIQTIIIEFQFSHGNAGRKKECCSHPYKNKNKNLYDQLVCDFSWNSLRVEVVGQRSKPKFKGRQKSAGRKGGQTPNNQEQIQRDTSKNSVRTVNLETWCLMLGEDGASEDKKLWGPCASGPPISKNHVKTSPHGQVWERQTTLDLKKKKMP